jgi:hypothetical protein
MSKAVKTSLQFVQSVELADPENSFPGDGRLGFESGEEAKSESYLSDKSLVSFTSGVSSQTREDILSSTLLAQLAANKKCPDDADLREWFKVYQDTLHNIGWVLQEKDWATMSDSESAFEMNEVIVDVLGAALGGTAVIVIKKALDAFKKLSDTNGKIIAFEKNTHSLTKGTFLIALCDETNDNVSMKIGAFQLSSSKTITQILFFKSSKDKTELSYSASDATFFKTAYDIVRLEIKNRLADKFKSFVASIDI